MKLGKLSIFTASIPNGELEVINALVGNLIVELPVLYHGIPLAARKLNVVHYAPLIDRNAAYISAWTAHSLSYVGRAKLIKAIVLGVEYY